jgi:predicted O-linked N-acetylglucosamine transferase (SPINDLY family)
MPDERVAEMIRADRIDILVDLTMHMARNRLRLFARKPAPVQVTWFAYPGSTGVEAIDYRLTDPHMDPPETALPRGEIYSEESIWLPDTFWCYEPLTNEPEVNESPAVKNGHITFGCLNNFCKVNEGVLRLWADVMDAVPGSRLIVLSGEVGQEEEQEHQRWAREIIEQGGDRGAKPGRGGRVRFVPFAPRPDYLRRYHEIDIGLETFPYNGHTTSLDAFWMGVPVVTLAGSTVVGRAGVCQLMNLGLPELIAHTHDEYVRIVTGLAADLPRLAELRAGLRVRMEKSPLMDAPRFARNMEAAYRSIWRKWCSRREVTRPLAE